MKKISMVIASIFVIAGCGGSSNNSKPVTMTITGFDSSVSQTANIAKATLSVTDYVGIGEHYGEAVVDGLKIRIRGASVYGDAGGTIAEIIDYGDSPENLEIAMGLSGTISGSGTLPNGTYKHLKVHVEPQYDLKAYAYLDRDQDGTPDTTIWTTPDGIQMSASQISSTSDMTDYGYFHYGFRNAGTANSATNSTFDDAVDGETTHFVQPLVIDDAPTYTDSRGEVVNRPSIYTLDARIDANRIVRVWDGTPESRENSTAFNVTNNNGIAITNFFPDNEPNFALLSIPLYAYMNESGLQVKTYALSDNAGFPSSETQYMTVVYLGNGVPAEGKVSGWGGPGFQPETFGFELVSENVYKAWNGGNGGDGLAVFKSESFNIINDFPINVEGTAMTLNIIDGEGCSSNPSQCFGTRTAYVKRIERTTY